MADQNSFDVVSKVDMQEVKNAIDQALKEIHQRFDFKGTKTELTLKEKESELVIVSDDEYKLKSVVDIVKAKLIKRTVSGDHQGDQGREVQGTGSDPRGSGAGAGQEPGRTSGRDRVPERQGLRDRSPVHQLPLGRAFHLRVEEVLELQFDAAGRTGDGLLRWGREDLFLLHHALADVIEMPA